MKHLDQLLRQNQSWVKGIKKQDPGFFDRLAQQHTPEYLWIGCSDSRVPANEILGLMPGDVFVHRNVANVVVHSDLNFLSVLQYAVDVLKIKNILVCGHYGCGGIIAALSNQSHGLIDNWLRHIQDVEHKHQNLLLQQHEEQQNKTKFEATKQAIMCELNVIEQAINVAKTTIVQDAWRHGQTVAIHAVVYALSNGLLQQIASGIESIADIDLFYTQAIDQVKNTNR